MSEFNEITTAQILVALQVMEVNGLILDEHSTFISSDHIEANPPELEQLLRRHGYCGGKLDHTGKFFLGYGAIYALFDSERHARASALAFIEDHKNRMM